MKIDFDYMYNLNLERNFEKIEKIYSLLPDTLVVNGDENLRVRISDEDYKKIRDILDEFEFSTVYGFTDYVASATFIEFRYRILFKPVMVDYSGIYEIEHWIDYHSVTLFQNEPKFYKNDNKFGYIKMLFESDTTFYSEKDDLIKVYYKDKRVSKIQRKKMEEYVGDRIELLI